MDINDLISRIAEATANRTSQIAGNIQGREALLKKVTLDLTTARSIDNALKISIPFKSVCIEAATDSTTKVFMAMGDNSLDAMRDSKQLGSNDSFEFDSMVSSAYLYWAAQAGKTLTLVFATTGNFRPGSQISQISGGLSISEGSALNSAMLGPAGNAATVAVTTAAVILPSDTDRKNQRLYTDADIWIGDASVAVDARGIPVPAGWFEWPCTSILYAVSVAGTANIYGNDTR